MVQDRGETGLPASFELAWGLRERPTKGPKRGLTLEQVVRAGVAVAAAEGFPAVSMNRVAKELGTSAMALYRYVASKDELVALMVDTALGDADVSEIVGDDGWRAGLERWSWAEIKAYRNNSWVLQAPLLGPPVTPNSIAFLEQGLRCLAPTALSPGEKMSVMLTLTSFDRAWAILSTQLDAAFQSPTAVTEAMADYSALLRKLTTREHFPALHEVLDAEVFAEDDDPDYDFVFGLARLLDGIETLITSKAR